MHTLVFGDFKAKVLDNIKLSPELTSLVSRADVTICNFEAPIQVDNIPPAQKSGPSISQSPLAPGLLENMGFNMMLLANNHMMDYGPDACLKTINAFSHADTIGAGDGHKAYNVIIKEYQGVRVGFLSLCQYEFGVVTSEASFSIGVAWINAPCVRDIIQENKQKVDYLLVFPHAGAEYLDAPLPEWRDVYKRMIDWGADCIIATHPHVPQGWETYKNKPVFYSLGNFYFEGRWGNPWCTKGLAVDLRIDKDHLSFEVIPISFNDGLVDVDNSEEYRIHREKICELLQKEDQYLNYINEKCQVLYKDMQYGLLRGLYGVSPRVSIKQNARLLGCLLLKKKNELFFLNAIRCESHRWVIERYLQNNNC